MIVCQQVRLDSPTARWAPTRLNKILASLTALFFPHGYLANFGLSAPLYPGLLVTSAPLFYQGRGRSYGHVY